MNFKRRLALENAKTKALHDEIENIAKEFEIPAINVMKIFRKVAKARIYVNTPGYVTIKS